MLGYLKNGELFIEADCMICGDNLIAPSTDGLRLPVTFRELCRQIQADLRAHGGDWTKPGFRAIAAYRFGVWRMKVKQPFRAPLSIIYRCTFRWCRNIYGIELPYTTDVGIDVVFENHGGIVVHGLTKIGDRCIIRQNCTLGIRSLNNLNDAPVLMNGVILGAGAVILGKVVIGSGSVIAPNSVVLTDIPAGTFVVGVPAEVGGEAH